MKNLYHKHIELTDSRDKLKTVEIKVKSDRIVEALPFLEPVSLFSVLARELVYVANKQTYKRVCPFKFETIDNYVYICFAEKSTDQFGKVNYVIKKRKLLKYSNSGNVKVYECFLYDLMDYLTYKMEYLSKRDDEYYIRPFKIRWGDFPYSVNEVVDEEYLRNNGFVMV